LVLAQRLGGRILSVDSMQVYRGMDIGTAKPTLAERAAVRHELIDVVEPTEACSVQQFVSAADAAIAGAAADGVPLIATGGTPMYYKALFEGLFEGPAADLALRDQLNAQPLETLHQRLRQVDPAAADRLHVNDRRRVVRALEVHELTGKTITEQQGQWEGAHRHAAHWFGLHWEKDANNRRINQRVKQMIDAGWLGECETLLARYGTLSPTAAEATGYHELFRHLRGEMTLEDAVEAIKIATRQLARRQIKWFRRFANTTWLAGEQSPEAIADHILNVSCSAPPIPPGA
jgi:tRNA dimethylallyltransferase